jgi:hypothetical protein
LNDGQRQIVAFKPEANVTTDIVALIAGTRQTIPASGLLLLDIHRNMGTDGVTIGNAPRYVKKRDMDMERPTWHTDTAAATVKHWMYDPRDPKVYWVWPPQPAASQGQVQRSYSEAPADIDIDIDTAITLDDIYSPVLHEYIMFRAYSKETKNAGYKERAAGHWAMFLQLLGLKEQAEQKDDPTVEKTIKVNEP